MSSDPDFSNRVQCPYDKSHGLILREHFQTHLVRCERNNPHILLEKCPFNSTHRIRKSEMDMHIRQCEDRSVLDLYKYTVAPKVATEADRTPAAESQYQPLPKSTENWGNDDAPTYNPQEYVMNAPVIRQLNVATRSEQRAFRKAERHRLNEMNRQRH